VEKLAASIFRFVQEEWITLIMEATSCIVDCVVLDVSKNNTASIFRVNQYNKKPRNA
jgi:ssDNA-binding replication factor A large subunit